MNLCAETTCVRVTKMVSKDRGLLNTGIILVSTQASEHVKVYISRQRDAYMGSLNIGSIVYTLDTTKKKICVFSVLLADNCIWWQPFMQGNYIKNTSHGK